MHPYSLDIDDKVKVYWIIVPLSLACGYMINEFVLKNLNLYQNYSWIVDVPSSGIALFAIFHELFDRIVWKWFSRMHFWFKTPVMDGEYEGELLSSRDGKQQVTKIEIKIKQTLSKVAISLHTSQSTSKSEMAAILVNEPDGPMLIYEFLNDHRKVADPQLTIHRGITRLTYKESDGSLEGIYYTSPERGNYGEIKVKKRIH